jgi:hypothetical protein
MAEISTHGPNCSGETCAGRSVLFKTITCVRPLSFFEQNLVLARQRTGAVEDRENQTAASIVFLCALNADALNRVRRGADTAVSSRRIKTPSIITPASTTSRLFGDGCDDGALGAASRFISVDLPTFGLPTMAKPVLLYNSPMFIRIDNFLQVFMRFFPRLPQALARDGRDVSSSG